MQLATKNRSRNGFTLIEILVVIVVIAVLASLVAPNVFQHVGAAKDTTARSQVEMLSDGALFKDGGRLANKVNAVNEKVRDTFSFKACK